MKKYYAVRDGRSVGIFETWDECKKSVTGYSGAKYKAFPSREEALAYLGARDVVPTPASARSAPDGGAVAYVDGSYNAKTKVYSCGAVIFFAGEAEPHTHSEAFSDAEAALMRNVAGEIEGAKYAMSLCIERNIRALTIYYDYEGVENWCTGAWKTNKAGTADYKRFYDEASKRLDIRFVKVRGHSGDKYNDLADSLAKDAAGIRHSEK